MLQLFQNVTNRAVPVYEPCVTGLPKGECGNGKEASQKILKQFDKNNFMYVDSNNKNWGLNFVCLNFFFLVIFCCCCLVAKSCPTVCNPMDCSPPGSSIHGISQTRILEWIVISFSRGSFQSRDWTQVSCIAGRFFTSWATEWSPASFYCIVNQIISLEQIGKRVGEGA